MEKVENIMGQRIKECRQNIKMTQEELGERLGVQAAAIRKYENGIVENIPRASIQKMATIFGVNPVWLMGFEEPNKDDTDISEILEELKNRSEMKMLFSVAKGATKEDIMRAVTIIEALRKND